MSREASHVPTGYELDRDERGLTANERQMLARLMGGASVSAAAREIGVSRQRGHQLVQALVKKGVIEKKGSGYVSTD